MGFLLANLLGGVTVSATGAWLVVAWVFALGGALGSFLNVVAYRLPRGMSLSHPGSRCPACGRPIRWYDNVPIAGWLLLGGRCRDCRAAISPRYPLVELIVAVASAAVAWSAIVPAESADGETLLTVVPLLVGFRLLLVHVLLCAALLEFDGNRAPPRMLIVVLVAGLSLPIFWPDLRPALMQEGMASPDRYDGALALAVALLLGALAWPMLVEPNAQNALTSGGTRIAELALVGAFLGTIAVAFVAVLAAVLCLTGRLASRLCTPGARFGWAASLALATLVWIAGTRFSAAVTLLPGTDVGTNVVSAGAIVAVLALVERAARGAAMPTPQA